jgi:hypothetical protein
MQIDKVSVVFGATDWEKEVEALTRIFGEPTMSQVGVWAQFDPSGARISIGSAEDVPLAALMVKVPDIEDARRELEAAGWICSETMLGEHELRVHSSRSKGVDVIAYQPTASSRTR